MATKIIPKNRKKDFESFQHYCLRNNLEFLLDLWDYDLNGDIDPDNIGAHSTKQKIYFKCPRGLHGSRAIYLNNICKSPEQARQYDICIGCKSIGQHIIDNYGKDYLDKIWSDKNEKSYFETYTRSFRKKIFLRCLNNNNHPDYDLSPSNFDKSHNCPYCAGKRICIADSLEGHYPESLKRWSDKNKKKPKDYMHNSGMLVWWECENNNHKPYQRTINTAIDNDFECPLCKGLSSWKGDKEYFKRISRHSVEYKNWRNRVLENDLYTCQCCGKTGCCLHAHHIYNYLTHEDLRLSLANGISLCEDCHSINSPKSFHWVYGVFNNTPAQLETYINNKRKQLGIDIPFTINDYRNRINILKPENLNIEKIPIEIKQEPNGSFI